MTGSTDKGSVERHFEPANVAFPERTGRQGAWRVRRCNAMTQPEKSSKIYDSKEVKKMLLAHMSRNNAVQK